MTIKLTCPQCGREYLEPADRCSVDGSALYGPDALARIGKQAGNYEFLKIQGVGGMGVVYRARHILLDKPVAIKVLHDRYARREGASEQFLREAKAATRIRHPNIVDVTDFGVAPDNSVYFVMEYLEGISLEDVLARDGLIPLFNAVNIVRQAARALAAAHEHGIVHRDLKPENFYLIDHEGRRRVVRSVEEKGEQRFVVEKEGHFDFVKLFDFGVAKYTQEDVSPSMSTRNGMIFGTPHYMSPEQARGEDVDGRSDIYALGIMFYEMITSFVPFDGESALDVLNGHVFGTVIPPKDRNPAVTVDEGTNRTILCCLEKEAKHRFQTMDELLDGLSECFTDQVFLRDAHRLPGAVESGIDPDREKLDINSDFDGNDKTQQTTKRPSSITTDLTELFTSGGPDASSLFDEEISTGDRSSGEPTSEEEVLLLTSDKAKSGPYARCRTRTNPGLGGLPVDDSHSPAPQSARPRKRATSALISGNIKKTSPKH